MDENKIVSARPLDVEKWRAFLEEERKNILEEKAKREAIEQITVVEYLARMETDDRALKISPTLAHGRIFDALAKWGVEVIFGRDDAVRKRRYGLGDNQALPRYAVFSGKVPEIPIEIVGNDAMLHEYVGFFHAGKMFRSYSEIERQLLLLIGPTAGGKNKVVDITVRALELSGPFWALAGCPFNEEPLHLIPRSSRIAHAGKPSILLGMLRANRIPLEGDLCPVCRTHLMKGWGEKELAELEAQGFPLRVKPRPYDLANFPVVMREFSSRQLVGFYEIKLTDETNFDLTTLVGRQDIQKMVEAESETALAVVNWDAAYPHMNRGLGEWEEFFKNPKANTRVVIGSTQDKRIPAPIPGTVSIDVAQVGHTNEEEFKKAKKRDAGNEAMLRRCAVLEVPYNLQVSEEVKLLRGYLAPALKPEGDFHLAPHADEVGPQLAVLSRFYPKEPYVTPDKLWEKMLILDGKEVLASGTLPGIVAVKNDRDGMFEALYTFRELRKYLYEPVLHQVATEGRTCVLPADVMDHFRHLLHKSKLALHFEEEVVDLAPKLAEFVRQRYNETVLEEARPILVANFQEEVEHAFAGYAERCLKWVEYQQGKEKPREGEAQELEQYLSAFEIGVMMTKKDHRRQFVESYKALARDGETPSYTEFSDLKAAFENTVYKFLKALRESVRGAAHTQDPRRIAQWNAILEGLKRIGYCEECAPRLVDYINTAA